MPTVSELQVRVGYDGKEAESGLASLGAKIGSAGSALATLGGAAVLGGIAALGAGLTASVSAAATFESKMSAVKAVSGATASEMTQLSGLALQLGKDTSFSASEAADGIGELVKAGVSMGDIMGGAAAASLNLAAAGGVEVAEAAEIASNAMNVFNLKGSEMGHVADVIAGAANASAIDVSDFKMSLAASGSVAATVGIGFEDLATSIAVMGQAGIKGSDAGTSLKTMMLNLTPATKGQMAVAKELGIVTADGANKFFDATGKAKSMAEIAGVLQTATAGLTEQQKLQALQTLFGTDAIRAAAVMAKAGAEGFNTMAESIGKVSAADVAKERLNNLKGSLEQLKGSVETAGIMIGTALLPGLKSMVDGLTAGINTGIGIIEKMPAAWASAIATFEGTANSADFSVIAEVLDQVFGKAATDVIIQNIGRMGDAWRTFQQATSGNWSPSDQIDPFVNAVGIATVAVKTLAETVSEASAKAEAMGAWENVKAGFSNLATAAKIGSDRVNDIAAALDRAHGPAGRTATAADVLAGAIKGAALGFQYVTIQIDGFVDMIGSSIAVVIDFVTAASRTGEALLRLQRGDIPGAVTALGEAKTAFGAGMTAAEEFRVRGVERVGAAAQVMADVVGIKMTATAAAVESNMSAANAALAEGSSGWQQAMEANGAGVAAAAETSMTAVVTATDTGMAGAVASVAAAAVPATAAAEAMGTGMASGIEAAAPAMTTAAEQGASGAVAAVEGQSGAALAAGSSVGQNLGAGMEGGILSRIGAVVSAARQMVAAALGAGQAEAEIESPSKKTMYWGQMLDQGIIDGIEKLAPDVRGTMHDLMSSVTDYIPVANQIAQVEKRIKEIREESTTAALFRAQEMVTIDSEVLRLKQDQVIAEGKLVPIRQDLARVGREIAEAERGSLDARKQAITLGATNAQQNIKVNELEKEKIPLRAKELELERILLGLDPNSKRAKGLKEEQEELRKKSSLIDNQISQIRLQTRAQELDAASYKESRVIESAGARIRKEEADDRLIDQEKNTTAIKDQITVLDAERAVFAANEALIKNATDNEIAYRNRLIAVFTAEGKPLADRITAGLALVTQLEKEGKISKELASSIRDVAKEAGFSAEKTTALGTASATAAPQMDAAAKKAEEMAKQAQALAEQAGEAKEQMSELAKESAAYARQKGSLFDPRPRSDSATMGGSAGAMIDAAAAGGVTGAYQSPAMLPVAMSDGGSSSGAGSLQRIQIDVTADGRVLQRHWIEGYKLLARTGGLPARFGDPA